MIRALFEQIAVPSKLRPLGLEEPLSLTAATLNRAVRAEFFKRFDDRHAVQYFYEPFLLFGAPTPTCIRVHGIAKAFLCNG
jgi:hypothetical protein